MTNKIKSGFILIDKPLGITSHGVIACLRRIIGIRKIGHAGTLDPFATGLLIVAIGREATKKIDQFVKLDKEYIAEVFLGAETDTYDQEGKIINSYDGLPIEKEKIEETLKKFLGKQQQIPPMFSAKKVNGKKLYELARKNIEIERKPSEIEIFDLELIEYGWPLLKIKVHCSSGTYIRSLAFDFGRELNCGAYLKGLRRSKIGEYNVEQSAAPDKIAKENWEELLFNK